MRRSRRSLTLAAQSRVAPRTVVLPGYDAQVRSNHVHVILEAAVPPEKVMNDLKPRRGGRRRRWARHGSTRWLWKDQDVRNAILYVVEEQGNPMAIFLGDVP